MTLLSQRLKFNMESIGTAMDKFSSLEGAIEASAKIQVLGGSFAQNFGNPLEVMSQALLDGEGFTNRIVDTVANRAKFDKKTGEVDVSPQDKMYLKAYAEALGMSYDEVFNMATQSRKSQEIKKATKNPETLCSGVLFCAEIKLIFVLDRLRRRLPTSQLLQLKLCYSRLRLSALSKMLQQQS